MKPKTLLQLAIYLCFLLFQLAPSFTIAQSSADTQDIEKIQQAVIDSLELSYRIKSLEDSLESEIKDAKRRYETLESITKFVAFIFGGIAVFGAVLSTIFAFLSWNREKKSQRRYDDLLSKNIENIEGLGKVINLIEHTFQLREKEHLKREKEEKKYQEQIGGLSQMVQKFESSIARFDNFFREQYLNLRNLTMSFQDVSRMDWPNISLEEEKIIGRAKTILEIIPEYIFDEKSKDNRSEVGRIFSILGISAFYNNDITGAERLLKKALGYYNTESGLERYDIYPWAVCHHYLGLIAKHWRRDENDPHLRLAKEHLVKADEQLTKIRDDEFLTPVTLAEVESYWEEERKTAKNRLDTNIKKLEKLSKLKIGLNKNQFSILTRAYLIRGNLEFMGNNMVEAGGYYKKALHHDNQNPYCKLSYAQTLPKEDPATEKFWKEGLSILESSSDLSKKEYTVRVWVLAWAIIASNHLGIDKEISYRKEFEDLGIRKIDGKEPLFFNPLTKKLATYTKLREDLKILDS